MKYFVKKISIFILVLLAVIIGLDFLSMTNPIGRYIGYLTNSNDYVESGPQQIIPCINEARIEDDTKILLVGDSVFSQMFSGFKDSNPSVAIIGTNGGVTVAGQYVIVHEYLLHHPEATDVFLQLNPVSCYRTFDADYGYQYAVEPLILTDTLKLLDEDTIDVIKKVYGRPFVDGRMCTLLDKSGINKKIYLNYLKNSGRYYEMGNAFELSDRYIVKIQDMCSKQGVNFHFSSGPVTKSLKYTVDNVYDDFEGSKLKDSFPSYLEDVYYIDDIETLDGTHFGGEYASMDNYKSKIAVIYQDSSLLEILRFE